MGGGCRVGDDIDVERGSRHVVMFWWEWGFLGGRGYIGFREEEADRIVVVLGAIACDGFVGQLEYLARDRSRSW